MSVVVHAKLARNTDGPRAKTEPQDTARMGLTQRIVLVLATLCIIPSLTASDPEYDQQRCDDLRGRFIKSDLRVPGSMGSLLMRRLT